MPEIISTHRGLSGSSPLPPPPPRPPSCLWFPLLLGQGWGCFLAFETFLALCSFVSFSFKVFFAQGKPGARGKLQPDAYVSMYVPWV